MKKLHIFTLVFGGKYLSYWRRAGAVSLLWPRNMEALNSMDVLWDIYTTKESEEEVREMAESLPFAKDLTVVGEDKETSLKLALEKAQRANAYFMHAPPDMIWGDGSVGNLLKLMPFAYGRCLAVTHLRVAANKFMASFDGEPMSNSSLVRMAFEFPHEAVKSAEVPSDRSNCVVTGMSWTKISEGLYAVGLFIPTIHMMQPTPADVKWFKTTKGEDHWDHRWPASLVGTDRHRFVASSDIAFMVELTEDEEAHPPIHPTKKGWWDHYNGNLPHHVQNRNTVSVLRASCSL